MLFSKSGTSKYIVAALLAFSFLLPHSFIDKAFAQTQTQNQSAGQSKGVSFKQIKNWSINRYSDSQSSSTPSCSAVKFIDRSKAIRIERVSDGFIFGLNGYRRDEIGSEVSMSFWFDGKRASKQSGQAGFFKDVAYELEDWLSFFVPLEDTWGTLTSIKNGVWISFEVSVPDNKTGNGLVISNLSLKGSTAALSALEECYQAATLPKG